MKKLIIIAAAMLSTASYAGDFGTDYWKIVAVKVGTFEMANALCPIAVDAETAGFLADMRSQLTGFDLLVAQASAAFRDEWKRDPIAACSMVQADIDTLATAKLPAKR
jgi:hypothetical protein